jgi:uncharacterized damage-inducible protein DinB
MGFAKEQLQVELDYPAWATRLLLDACAALSDEERMRDLGLSHRNVVGTLGHMFVSERFWADCLRSDRLPPLDEIGVSDSPEPAFTDLIDNWPAVWGVFDNWLASAPEEKLTETLRCRLTAETERHFTRWQLLRHSMNHSTLHRGQVVGMVRALGRKPPNVDLMSYYLAA